MKSPHDPKAEAQTTAAFTRIELLAVVAAVSLVASVLLPALGREISRDSRVFCLFRMNRLAQAMTLYAQDSRGWLPPNPDDGNTTPFWNWVGGQAGPGGAQEFNPDILRDPTHALLTPYLQGDISVYRCSMDQRMGSYQGTNSTLKGTKVPAARTVSMNSAVGTLPDFGGKSPVYGPWLSGSHNETVSATWFCYGRMSDFVRPGPAAAFTFIEEDANSINDGVLGCVGPSSPQKYTWIDWPATYHDMAGGVSFADGHAEMHRWQDTRTRIVNGNVASQVQPNNPDIAWLAQRTSALIVPPAN
jgi:type II secretory pathway pseudopilin PulG